MFYRIPYKIHGPRAQTKAGIAWGEDRLPSRWVEFEAGTRADAQHKLQDMILPGDPRPILGRTGIRTFASAHPFCSICHKPTPMVQKDSRVCESCRYLPSDDDTPRDYDPLMDPKPQAGGPRIPIPITRMKL